MSNSVYYKATDEDGNTVLIHGWKKHKYLYIKNGKYVYPEDIYKTAKKRVKKTANFAKKVATRDAAFKMAATKYLVDKAVNSPTANAAKSKARSVVSKAEYKIERAGQKLTNDVKSSGAYKSAKKTYKSAKKGINSISRDANKAYKSAKKKAKKVNRTLNEVKRFGKAYLNYLTK